MQVDSPEKIRNIAIAGHSDTGKTTLVSSLSYAGGVVNRLNRVEDGNTITDFDPEEIERKISIGLSICHTPWRQHKINLLDCPGYGIFFDETRSAMYAADAAIICINASAGIEVTAEKAWDFAAKLELPTMITLTKMDQPRAKGKSSLDQIHTTFGREAVLVQLPIGKGDNISGVVDLVNGKAYSFAKDGNGKGKSIEIPDEMKEEVERYRNTLIESVAETDDSLIEEFFEVGTLPTEDLIQGLRNAIRKRKVFPVTLVAAGHGIGVSTFLDAVVDLLPSPTDRSSFPGVDFGGEPIEVAASPDAPMSTLVFKTMSDPFTGKVSLLRVVSGVLPSDSLTWNTQKEEPEKVGHLMTMQGKQGEVVSELITGDIGGVAKLKNASTGDTLSTKEQPIRLAWMKAVEPAISFAIEPKSKGDEEKIGEALARLIEEDPSLLARRDQETGEFLLSGAGQLHVEIAVARLHKRFHVDVILHPPKVPYRETIRKKAAGHGRHKKQSGGRGQFADCKILMEPSADGEFEFIDEIFGGAIPQGYRPAVDKGIQEAAQRGYLAGFPVVGFKVRLQDGQYHDVDSSEMAFKIAGSLAFKDAMSKAGATLLEPVMKVEISTSEEFMGDIMSDLSQRRGRPQGMDTKNGTQVVKATVPLAEMLDYAPALTS
ncbi:MAG: elongation factor G, partial [Acidobacteriota bacterium]